MYTWSTWTRHGNITCICQSLVVHLVYSRCGIYIGLVPMHQGMPTFVCDCVALSSISLGMSPNLCRYACASTYIWMTSTMSASVCEHTSSHLLLVTSLHEKTWKGMNMHARTCINIHGQTCLHEQTCMNIMKSMTMYACHSMDKAWISMKIHEYTCAHKDTDVHMYILTGSQLFLVRI